MEQTGTFPVGIAAADGNTCRDFTLHERAFRHTLEVARDKSIDNSRLNDPVYYDAAILSKRLEVAGLERLTPEMILDLDGDDGDELATAIMNLDQRRAAFRSTQRTNAETATGAPEAGGAVAGDSGYAVGGGGQSAAQLPGDCRSQTEEDAG